MDTLSYQNVLFGESFPHNILEHGSQTDDIMSFLEQKEITRDATHRENIITALCSLEATVSTQHYTATSLEDIVTKNAFVTAGLFLSETTISTFLQKNPPSNLLRFLHEHPAIPLTNQAILTLGRFTEDDTWQKQHKALIAQTTRDEYELKKPCCIGIDTVLFKPLLERGRGIKPWGVSHCKETGVIVIFENHRPDIITPTFLTLFVFFHYLYEVETFSHFLKQLPETATGTYALKVIESKHVGFSFLKDGNAHDETLYWRKAFRTLCSLFPDSSFSLFETHAHDLFYDEYTMYSLNVIDVLWDINNIYPEKNNTYHLQQEVWLSLEEKLSQQSPSLFEQCVAEALMLDNMAFFEHTLLFSKKKAESKQMHTTNGGSYERA